MFWSGMNSIRAFQLNQIMRQGGILLGSVLLAKSPLSLLDIGHYEQYLYIQYACTFFWITGFIQAILSFYPTLDSDRQLVFLRTAYLVLMGLASITAVGLAVIMQFNERPTLPWLNLFVWTVGLNTPTYLIEYILLLRDRARPLVWYSILAACGTVGVVAVPICLGLGVYGILVGWIGLGVLKQVWLLLLLFGRNTSIYFSNTLLRPWFLLALPLIAYTLLGGLIPTLTGGMVHWFYNGDQEPFAVFRYGAREFPLTVALSDALSAALIPLLSKGVTEGASEVRNRAARLMHFLFPLSIVLILSSSWWFPKVFSTAFVESIPVFNCFLLIVSSRLIFSKSILIALKDNRAVLAFSIIELVLLVIIGFSALKMAGLPGLAGAVALVFTLEKGMQVARLYFRHGISPNAYLPLRWWFMYSSILVAAWCSSLFL